MQMGKALEKWGKYCILYTEICGLSTTNFWSSLKIAY